MLLQRRAGLPFSPLLDSVCFRCLVRFRKHGVARRPFNASAAGNQTIAANQAIRRNGYFSNNGTPGYLGIDSTVPIFRDEKTHASSTPSILQPVPNKRLAQSADFSLPSTTSEPPHRRRKRLKAAIDDGNPLPLDASSQLSAFSSSLPAESLSRLLTTCLSLAKPRLSSLIVLTTASAYSLFPVPALLLPETTASPSLSALTLVFLTSGTALTCASANALNMLIEPKYDAQMSRTRNRPLVRNLIGKRGALIFAMLTGGLGVGSLWFGVNPTVAFLGGLNILLYAGIYTPMKRLSVLNTWVGAVVGAIPPLMGWAAAAGQSATGSGEWKELLFSESSIGGWLIAALLFAWQFPHFNSLSWPIREEYKNAGYRMLVWANPRMNGRVALRYSLLMFPICAGLWWFEITDTGFLATSSVVNGWMVKEAWRFWRQEGHRGSARGLFWASVWHLPVIMVLAMVQKKGLWAGIVNRWTGASPDGEEIQDWEGESIIS